MTDRAVGLIAGTVVFGGTFLLIAAIIAGGHTFGQRCEAKGFIKWSDEWDACVSQLKGGCMND